MKRPKCRATTKAGAPCAKPSAAGSAYCGAHGGAKRRIGAKLKLDGATINTLVEVVERGVTWDVAAAAIGVNVSTLHRWRETGEDDLEAGRTTLHSELCEALTRASAAGEVHLVKLIRANAYADWRAAAFLLERRAPERWARRDALDVNVNERAKPRTVAPAEGRPRDAILAILATATRPPATTT